MYYFRARYYAPAYSRFISEDPLGLQAGANLFGYVGDNPVRFSDPFGLLLSPWHGLLTTTAMLASGYGPHTAAFVAGYNMGQDFRPGSLNVENAYRHAMAEPDQSPTDAARATNRFIAEQLATGSHLGLAEALHTTEDKYSRSHAGYQEWHGGLPEVDHILGDLWPGFGNLWKAFKDDLATIERFKQQRRSKSAQ
jgi:uncharacterized protein RhaS with RHS repeats